MVCIIIAAPSDCDVDSDPRSESAECFRTLPRGLTTSNSKSFSSLASDDPRAESKESRLMISSFAPFQKFTSPNAGDSGRLLSDFECKNDRGCVCSDVSFGDDKVEVEGGGKKDSSESGTRLMIDMFPTDIAAPASESELVVQSEGLRGNLCVWNSGRNVGSGRARVELEIDFDFPLAMACMGM